MGYVHPTTKKKNRLARREPTRGWAPSRSGRSKPHTWCIRLDKRINKKYQTRLTSVNEGVGFQVDQVQPARLGALVCPSRR